MAGTENLGWGETAVLHNYLVIWESWTFNHFWANSKYPHSKHMHLSSSLQVPGLSGLIPSGSIPLCLHLVPWESSVRCRLDLRTSSEVLLAPPLTGSQIQSYQDDSSPIAHESCLPACLSCLPPSSPSCPPACLLSLKTPSSARKPLLLIALSGFLLEGLLCAKKELVRNFLSWKAEFWFPNLTLTEWNCSHICLSLSPGLTGLSQPQCRICLLYLYSGHTWYRSSQGNHPIDAKWKNGFMSKQMNNKLGRMLGLFFSSSKIYSSFVWNV